MIKTMDDNGGLFRGVLEGYEMRIESHPLPSDWEGFPPLNWDGWQALADDLGVDCDQPALRARYAAKLAVVSDNENLSGEDVDWDLVEKQLEALLLGMDGHLPSTQVDAPPIANPIIVKEERKKRGRRREPFYWISFPGQEQTIGDWFSRGELKKQFPAHWRSIIAAWNDAQRQQKIGGGGAVDSTLAQKQGEVDSADANDQAVEKKENRRAHQEEGGSADVHGGDNNETVDGGNVDNNMDDEIEPTDAIHGDTTVTQDNEEHQYNEEGDQGQENHQASAILGGSTQPTEYADGSAPPPMLPVPESAVEVFIKAPRLQQQVRTTAPPVAPPPAVTAQALHGQQQQQQQAHRDATSPVLVQPPMVIQSTVVPLHHAPGSSLHHSHQFPPPQQTFDPVAAAMQLLPLSVDLSNPGWHIGTLPTPVTGWYQHYTNLNPTSTPLSGQVPGLQIAQTLPSPAAAGHVHHVTGTVPNELGPWYGTVPPLMQQLFLNNQRQGAPWMSQDQMKRQQWQESQHQYKVHPMVRSNIAFAKDSGLLQSTELQPMMERGGDGHAVAATEEEAMREEEQREEGTEEGQHARKGQMGEATKKSHAPGDGNKTMRKRIRSKEKDKELNKDNPITSAAPTADGNREKAPQNDEDGHNEDERKQLNEEYLTAPEEVHMESQRKKSSAGKQQQKGTTGKGSASALPEKRPRLHPALAHPIGGKTYDQNKKKTMASSDEKGLKIKKEIAAEADEYQVPKKDEHNGGAIENLQRRKTRLAERETKGPQDVSAGTRGGSSGGKAEAEQKNGGAAAKNVHQSHPGTSSKWQKGGGAVEEKKENSKKRKGDPIEEEKKENSKKRKGDPIEEEKKENSKKIKSLPREATIRVSPRLASLVQPSEKKDAHTLSSKKRKGLPVQVSSLKKSLEDDNVNTSTVPGRRVTRHSTNKHKDDLTEGGSSQPAGAAEAALKAMLMMIMNRSGAASASAGGSKEEERKSRQELERRLQPDAWKGCVISGAGLTNSEDGSLNLWLTWPDGYQQIVSSSALMGKVHCMSTLIKFYESRSTSKKQKKSGKGGSG